MHVSNNEFIRAFPESLRDDAYAALSVLPENVHSIGSFTVKVAGEILSLPNRVYHDPKLIGDHSLTASQKELLYALQTRHCDGHIRQENLSMIISTPQVWIPPFIVKLMGEYVVEILDLIEKNLHKLDSTIYLQFANENPEFIARTEKRIESYWSCYYRHVPRSEYAGFRLQNFLNSLASKRPKTEA